MKKEDIKRNKDEGFWAYCSRLYREKLILGKTNKEIYEIIKEETGTNMAESSIRCNSAIWNECLEYCREQNFFGDNNEELAKLDKKIQELEKLKFQVSDQKRINNSYIRSMARWEHMEDSMIKAIEDISRTYVPIKDNDICIINGTRKAVLMLSDWHIGMTNDTSHNVYNLEVAKYRLEELYNKVVNRCVLHGVNELNIEILGDMTNGLIHLSTRVNNEEDVISQTMLVAEMLSDFVSKLANIITNVKVHGTIGNHGRCSANIKENIEVENFERLITWYMKSRLDKYKNIEIFDNYEEDIILYKVFDTTICSVHGHKEKYADAVKNMCSFLHIWIDELHLGHFHSHNVKTDNDMITIVNGSFAGTDNYAESLRRSNRPSQTLLIYNQEGQECSYNIKL